MTPPAPSAKLVRFQLWFGAICLVFGLAVFGSSAVWGNGHLVLPVILCGAMVLDGAAFLVSGLVGRRRQAESS